MNNNPKGRKIKKPLIFYYAVMLLGAYDAQLAAVSSLLQRQVTEVSYDGSSPWWTRGQVETIIPTTSRIRDHLRAKNDKGKDALYKTGIFRMTSWSAVCWGQCQDFAAEIPTRPLPLLSMLISTLFQLCFHYRGRSVAAEKDDEEHGRQHDELRQNQRAKIYAGAETGKTFADVASPG